MPRDFHQFNWDAALEADCRNIIRAAVLEDLDRGYDWTSVALVSSTVATRTAVVARNPGIVAGLPAAALVVDELDKELRFRSEIQDGSEVSGRQTIAFLEGPARSVLAAERLILNLLGRLSGIATLAHAYVSQVAGTGVAIYDTRKTTPGWRRLEKYAVRQGGGWNHRSGLFDAILIKDNHLALLQRSFDVSVSAPTLHDFSDTPSVPARAVRMAREFVERTLSLEQRANMPIEVEIEALADLEATLAERPDIVLLDNMAPQQLRTAVELRNARAPEVQLEASGGVTLHTVRTIAETGVDRISVGALTHSACSLDIGLDWVDGSKTC